MYVEKIVMQSYKIQKFPLLYFAQKQMKKLIMSRLMLITLIIVRNC